ncbi:hypothetical protein QMK33_05325 [Hymenobacter sp. H14-R3]|uniref:hypothetical protein n=1 Tax=Hymenobacter sp. H14-R3 TaxID=3046308 RepID=UPI0024BAE3CD|nr:hypothetical protein [Hymenobacter sp. H14-R3]MDJ0364565.1 hypothetical protein [Hymenobacter sp. H14-R3]
MSLFFPYLLLTIGGLTIAYVTGRLLLGQSAEATEPYFGVFLAMVTGLSLWVGTYAAVQTGGHTVMLPVPLLMGWLIWKQRGSVVKEGLWLPHALGYAMVIAVVLYVFRFWLFYDSESTFLATPFQDYVFYARVSLALNKTGIESTVLESVFPQFIGAQPYHYYELWLNALLVRCTGLSAMWGLCLSTYTILLTIVALGLRALVAHFGHKATWAWPLTVLLLLSGGVKWPAFLHYDFTKNGSLLAGSQVLLEPKLAAIAVFIALGVLLLVRRRYDLAGLVLACIPLVYVSTGPAIGGSTVVLGGYLWLSRRATYSQVTRLLLPMFLTIGYFGVFYVVQPASFQLREPGLQLIDELVPKLVEARTLLNIFIGSLILYGLFFGLLLAACVVVTTRCAWLSQRKELLPVLVWAGACAVLAAAGRTLATHFIDGFQFSGNVMGALVPTLLAVVLGAAFGGVNTWRRLAALTLLAGAAVVNCYPLLQDKFQKQTATVYSAAFLSQVQAALPDREVRGGFLFGDKDYDNTYMLSEDTYSAGTYLAGLSNRYDLMSLSIFAVDSLTTDPRYRLDSVQARQRLHSASLYRYARLMVPSRHMPTDSLQYQFVKQYELAFICASAKATLPEILRPLVAREIMDPRSGEKVYILKQ